MKIQSLLTLTAILTLSGCATAPNRIDVVHADPNQFRDMDCPALEREIMALDDRLGREHEALDRMASFDGFQATISVLVPIIPVGLGTEHGTSREREILFGREKGRAIGMRREALRKQCQFAGVENFPDEMQAIEDGKYKFKVSDADVANSLAYPADSGVIEP